MKKLVSILLAALLAAGLFGCGAKDGAAPGAVTSGSSALLVDDAKKSEQELPPVGGSYDKNMLLLWGRLEGIWAEDGQNFICFDADSSDLFLTFLQADGSEKTGLPVKLSAGEENLWYLMLQLGQEMEEYNIRLNPQDENSLTLENIASGEVKEYFRSSGFAQDQDLGSLFAQLSGIWISQTENFTEFMEANNRYYCSVGKLSGDDRLESEVTGAVHAATGEWILDVMFEGTDQPCQLELTLVLGEEPPKIAMSDVMNNGEITEFKYGGTGLSDVNSPSSPESMTQPDAWSRYAGIWARQEQEQLEFIRFDAAENTFSWGILFSDGGLCGTVSEFQDRPGMWLFEFTADCPAIHDGNIDREASSVRVGINYGGTEPDCIHAAIGNTADFKDYYYVGTEFKNLGTMEEIKAKIARG